MSATNRGGKRRENDFYETPEEVTRDFLFNHKEIVKPKPCVICERMIRNAGVANVVTKEETK